jgi:hypothetical protein
MTASMSIRAAIAVGVTFLALVLAMAAIGLGLPPIAAVLLLIVASTPVVGRCVLAGLALARPEGRATLPAVVGSTAGRLRLLRLKAESYLEEAIAEAERLVRLEPADAIVADELSRLYDRAGRSADAARAATMAIERALGSGQMTVAADVLRRFAADRDALTLRPSTLDRLGWASLQGREFDAAAWCFGRLAAQPGDRERVQKSLVAVADAAAAAGDVNRALAVYRTFLDTYPGAGLDAYVRSAIARIERTL